MTVLKPIPATIAVLFVLSCFALADTIILVALPSELDGVRKEVRLVGQSVELAGHRVSIGYRKGEKIYIVRTGAGIINAAMTTQALLTRYKVDRVISIGVAGNLNDQWAVGDVLCVTNVVSHQAGKETPAGFETGGKPEVRIQKSEEYQKKCEALRSNAVEIAKILISNANTNTTTETVAANNSGVPSDSARHAQGDNPRIQIGRLVSGDSFIASTGKRKWLRETFNADAVDMVSVGIARVCEANSVPYVILRVLSDNADESASADFAAFVNAYRDPVAAQIAVKLVEQIAPKPH